MPTSRRLVVLVAVATLALTGCGGAKKGSGTPTPTTSSPTSSVSVPDGQQVTAPGSKLSFGDAATVQYEPTKDTGTLLQLSVDSARKGRLSDFKGFNMSDPYQQNANYYYVKVSVKNVGTTSLDDTDVPLWGVSGVNTLLPAVKFTSSFKICQTDKTPKKFGPGSSFSTCLVYLSPDHGDLAGVSYRPVEAYNPIMWTGTVKPPAKPKKHHKKG